MNFYQARPRLAQAGAVFAAAALIAGCGNNYRPSITSISNSGPPAQPASYVAVVSAPSASAPGVATIIDYSGDSIIATATIGPGPTSFTLDATGTTAYTIQSDQTMWSFPVSTSLQEKQVSYTTLPPNAQPLNLLAPSAGLWASDLSGNLADLFQGSPETYVRSVPVAPAPVMLAGAISSPARLFALSQNIAAPTGVECNTPPFSAITSNGTATGIETSNFSVSSQLVLDPSNPTNDPHGAMNARCPVYAVVSSDGQRLFVLNRGSDTVSVINIPNDTLDNCVCPSTGCVNQDNQKYTCHPILPLSLNAVAALNTITPTPSYATPPNGTSGMTQTAGPVYAEYNGATNQLVVANYDAGTISVIDVTLDEYGNDSPTFGTTYTIPVGANPASVTVLYDGSRAYTANQTDQTVTIVYLASHTVKKTLTGITGHPRTVVSTQNSTQGKVYVASPDREVLTIIRTDQDIVDTTLPMVGNIVDTRVSSQNAVGGNSNNVSRIPGYGQPCNLPPSLEPAPVGAQTPLQVCQQMP
ncbi:MAG: hypothetical protein ABR991_09970 [Terracidiphilus sp.]